MYTKILLLLLFLAPRLNIVPYYSSGDNTLTKLAIVATNLTVSLSIHCFALRNMYELEAIALFQHIQVAMSDGTSMFIDEYNISYSDPTTGNKISSTIIVYTCGEDTCETNIALPSSLSLLCDNPKALITITIIAADSRLGCRPLSDPIVIGISVVLSVDTRIMIVYTLGWPNACVFSPCSCTIVDEPGSCGELSLPVARAPHCPLLIYVVVLKSLSFYF